MNLADQIETIARRATDQVVSASHAFSETQRRLADELEEHRAAGAVDEMDPDDSDQEYYESELDDSRHRDPLEDDLDADDTAARILFPADSADADTRFPRDDE
ncbi:hypothetical protein AAFP35_07735 [Gordonia sp. CPCC 206044]|uniref:hypothetical protein n=1 Tax=Gordonia sp. CPCC 206044 TaxID=3140793 RepID=UPI003AF38EA7